MVTRAHHCFDYESVLVEDVEENALTVDFDHGGFRDEELIEYVGVYFPEEVESNHLVPSTDPELNHKGSRIAWIEAAETGELIPIAAVRSRSVGMERGKGDALVDSDLDGVREGNFGGGSGALDGIGSLTGGLPLPLPLLRSRAGSIDFSHGDDEELEDRASAVHQEFAIMQRVAYLIVQGIFAGFCFSTIFARTAVGGDDVKLLLLLQPIAQNVRRFIYVLSALSLVGSVDLYLSIRSSRSFSSSLPSLHRLRPRTLGSSSRIPGISSNIISNNQNSGRRGGGGGGSGAGLAPPPASALSWALLVAAMHLAAYAVTVYMSSTDVLIHSKFGLDDAAAAAGSPSSLLLMSTAEAGLGAEGDLWAEAAMQDAQYRREVSDWQSLDNARLAFALAAWLGSCLIVAKELWAARRRSLVLRRLRETGWEWLQRVRVLEGHSDSLASLHTDELCSLIHLQNMGLERAKGALELYEDLHDAGGAGELEVLPLALPSARSARGQHSLG